MSSAVQTSPVVSPSDNQLHRPICYAREMFNTLKPFMSNIDPLVGTIRSGLKEGPAALDPFAANDQLIHIYQALGHARKAVEDIIPRTMLENGGSHIFFSLTNRPQQGNWVREVYNLVSSTESEIRRIFRKPTDPLKLMSALTSKKISEAPSLTKLQATFNRYNRYTGEIRPHAQGQRPLGSQQ